MTVFYRKYRPQKFSEIIGQENIVKTLVAQLASGKIAHGYLFFGPKGTGKTSTARIFAKAVNCKVYSSEITNHSKKKLKTQDSTLKTSPREWRFGEPCNKCQSCIAVVDGSHLDLLEIDAASNRGIDEIRDLKEKIKLSPVSSRFKVYIIDEAHMLTTEAFNALLKTLEEPPEHAIFILCTTAVSKLPATIISRLSRFNFKRANVEFLGDALARVARAEKIDIDRDALSSIAKISDGSFRDALSHLDLLSVSKKKISASDVFKSANIFQEEVSLNFLSDLGKKDLKVCVITIEKLATVDADLSVFIKDTILLCEKMLLIKVGIDYEISPDLIQGLGRLAANYSSSEIQQLMRLFLVAENEMRIYPLAKIPLILAVFKYCGDVDKQDEIAPLAEPKQADARSDIDKIVAVIDEEIGSGAVGIKVLASEKSQTDKVNSKSKRTTKSLAQVEKNWDIFLAKLKPVNAHLVAFLKSTRPISFDGVNLFVDVFYRFHKERLEEPKIAKIIDSILGDVMGQTIKLRLNLVKGASKPPSVVRASDVVEPAGDDLSRIAVEIFTK